MIGFEKQLQQESFQNTRDKMLSWHTHAFFETQIALFKKKTDSIQLKVIKLKKGEPWFALFVSQ